MIGLILPGTVTRQLQADRMPSAVLIECDTVRFVYDSGRGITQRPTLWNIRQDDLSHIVISHFHPDYFSDIIP